MSYLVLFIIFILLGFFFSPPSWWPNRLKAGRRLPPGPLALPIIGNLHMLGELPHRALHKLANRYGPIMYMRLGSVPTIVVSSPQAAELFLKTHDANFANRPKAQVSFYLTYGTKGIGFTEYGPYWRNIRKLCALHLLSVSKIDYFASVRREKVALVVDSLKLAAAAREVVDVSAIVGDLTINMVSKLLFGPSSINKVEVKQIAREALQLAGAFNISDFISWLAPFDLQGLTRRMKACSKAMDKVLEEIIDDHEQSWQNGQPRDFVDVMISLMKEHRNSHNELEHMIDRTDTKAILVDIISASFDTAATTVEWTISELLRHPRVMKCVQKELETVVGMNRMVNEADLSKLTYLEMVIKESFRLHPVAPLLVPHESIEDISIDGFHIPRKSRIIVNIWSIGRDPNVWSENTEDFFPERFKDTNIDIRGQDFELIPFGSGRRRCPGIYLGITMVRLVLAQLLHCFNWKLADGTEPHELDMKEIFGITVPRAQNLVAMPTYRLFC